mmetsp:Transcript_92690/g.264785  ORF Transcript_92690/g.264785 Transcript_92690/m.264785 type:complete len:112 (-) Transcript_92690:215-550(-)
MRRLKETIRLNQTNRCPGCHESFQKPPTKLMDETDYSHYNVPKLLPCLHTVSQKFLRQYVAEPIFLPMTTTTTCPYTGPLHAYRQYLSVLCSQQGHAHSTTGVLTHLQLWY